MSPSISKAKEKVKRLSAKLPIHRSASPLIQAAGPPGCAPPYAVADETDLAMPEVLRSGVEMLKVSEKKKKRVVFRLDPEQGQILYTSDRSGVFLCFYILCSCR